MPQGRDEMMFEDHATDAFGHKKLGGIGDYVSRGKGALGEIQQRQNGLHHHPEPGIPGALGRSRCD